MAARRTLRKEIPWRIHKLEIEYINQEVVHLKLHIICFAAIAVLSSAVLAAKKPAPKPAKAIAVIETDKGVIKFDL